MQQTIRQGTGKLDKNKREIRDGDIVIANCIKGYVRLQPAIGEWVVEFGREWQLLSRIRSYDIVIVNAL
jgi:hypothetical protein